GRTGGPAGGVPVRPVDLALDRAAGARLEELRHHHDLLAGRAADGAAGVRRGGPDRRRRCLGDPPAHPVADPAAVRGDHHHPHRQGQPARLRHRLDDDRRRSVLLYPADRDLHLPDRLPARAGLRATARVRLRRRLLLRRGDADLHGDPALGGPEGGRGAADDQQRPPGSGPTGGASMTTVTRTDTPTAPTEPPRRIKQRRFSRREKIWAVAMSVVLLLICLAWIYPFIWTISSSVKNTTEIFGSLNPFNPVLRVGNWTRAWTEANMGRFFFNFVFVTAGSIVISVTAAALMGYALG